MRIDAQSEKDYLTQVFDKKGFSKENGELLANTLVDADLRGISSHGIQRLAWYLNMVKEDTILPQNEIKVLNETPTSMLVDANKNMGQIACDFTMNHLIDKAKKSTLSVGVVRNSNHFGTAGYWARKAAEKGLIGIALTNTRPLAVPTNALDAFLGSNAFAFTFPADPHPFVFDGATSVVAGGKIQVADKNNQDLPGSWVVDKNRNLVSDSERAEKILYNNALSYNTENKGGGVLTLGGQKEINSNYKGFGNSLIVELLTGILAQGSISADTVTGKHDFSQYLMAIDPSTFGDLDTLKKNAEQMFDRIRNLDHTKGTQVMIPGDREYRRYDEHKKNGVEIDDVTADQIRKIGQEVGVEAPKRLSDGD